MRLRSDTKIELYKTFSEYIVLYFPNYTKIYINKIQVFSEIVFTSAYIGYIIKLNDWYGEISIKNN